MHGRVVEVHPGQGMTVSVHPKHPGLAAMRSAAQRPAFIDRLHADGNTILLVTHEEEIAARAARVVRLSFGDSVQRWAGAVRMLAKNRPSRLE